MSVAFGQKVAFLESQFKSREPTGFSITPCYTICLKMPSIREAVPIALIVKTLEKLMDSLRQMDSHQFLECRDTEIVFRRSCQIKRMIEWDPIWFRPLRCILQCISAIFNWVFFGVYCSNFSAAKKMQNKVLPELKDRVKREIMLNCSQNGTSDSHVERISWAVSYLLDSEFLDELGLYDDNSALLFRYMFVKRFEFLALLGHFKDKPISPMHVGILLKAMEGMDVYSENRDSVVRDIASYWKSSYNNPAFIKALFNQVEKCSESCRADFCRRVSETASSEYLDDNPAVAKNKCEFLFANLMAEVS